MKSEKKIEEKLKEIQDLDGNKDFNDGYNLDPETQQRTWINALRWILK